MPRFLARWVCSRSGAYRSSFNSGYRTYTYSFAGYRGLFRRAGLRIAAFWIAPHGYNAPIDLVPVHGTAIEDYTRRLLTPRYTLKGRLLNRLKKAAASEWFWRWFGSDYVFLLEATDA
jgi:hypothetical protein